MPENPKPRPKRRRLPHAGPPLAFFCRRVVRMVKSLGALPDWLQPILDSLKSHLADVEALESQHHALRSKAHVVGVQLRDARGALRKELVRLDLGLSSHLGPRSVHLERLGLPQRRKPGRKRRRRPAAGPSKK